MAISLMNKICVFTQRRIFLHNTKICNYYDNHNNYRKFNNGII